MTPHPTSVSCPANNCSYGDVILREWRNEDGDGAVVLAGFCDSCGFPSVYCQECEITLLVDDEERKCDGCEAVYQQGRDRKGLTESFLRVS